MNSYLFQIVVYTAFFAVSLFLLGMFRKKSIKLPLIGLDIGDTISAVVVASLVVPMILRIA